MQIQNLNDPQGVGRATYVGDQLLHRCICDSGMEVPDQIACVQTKRSLRRWQWGIIMHNKDFGSAPLKIGFVIVAIAIVYILSLLAPLDVQKSLREEGSWIELPTLAGYLAALVYIVARQFYSELKWIFWLIVLLMMRELDFDARFTDAKITKTDFLFNSDIPLLQTIYGFSLLAFVALVAFKVVTTHGRDLLIEAKAASYGAMALVLAVLAAVSSKLIDGPRRKFGYIGVELTDKSLIALQLLEEVLELGIPLFILVALTEYAKRSPRIETH